MRTASLRYRNRVEIEYVNRNPIRYDFWAGAKAIRFSVNMAVNLLDRVISTQPISVSVLVGEAGA